MTGRGTGDRGGIRDEIASEGSVLERVMADVLGLAGMADKLGWKPARWRSTDWPDADPRELDWGREAVPGAVGGISNMGDKSESWRSGGGGVVSRFSSETVEGGDTWGKREEGATDAGSEISVDDLDLWVAETWSFNIDTSTLASSITY